ncbi:Senescence regulator [Parasponia andersonii]|uniref:Senescence regulator n=1 Tax=Parasponia andersonii TaxID=3476 RepID=A0A2P5D7S3_PARAD|nr:Senescence regulator [Parasponia andersonii]
MASRNYIYPAPSLIINDNPRNPTVPDSLFEFDESEIWNSTCPNPAPPMEAATATKKWIPISREPIKKMGMMRKMISSTKTTPASSSVPVNVPDWSKILKDDYKVRDVGDDFSDGGDDDHHGGGGDWIPPHEYLARTRGASLSVHEGVGRTLKGRDLRRVRNAIWKKVGFED